MDTLPDEADKLIQKYPAIASLLRNGYRRGVYYGFKVPAEGKKWDTARRSLFGPKAFDFHTFLEPPPSRAHHRRSHAP